jgi:predicted lipid-binding transport protein (Tim44 family)
MARNHMSGDSKIAIRLASDDWQLLLNVAQQAMAPYRRLGEVLQDIAAQGNAGQDQNVQSNPAQAQDNAAQQADPAAASGFLRAAQAQAAAQAVHANPEPYHYRSDVIGPAGRTRVRGSLGDE